MSQAKSNLSVVVKIFVVIASLLSLVAATAAQTPTPTPAPAASRTPAHRNEERRRADKPSTLKRAWDKFKKAIPF